MQGFMDFGQFSGNDDHARTAECSTHVGNAFGNAMRRLVKHQQRSLRRQARQFAAAFGPACRQKTAEQESARLEAAGRQHCGRSIGPGKRHHRITRRAHRRHHLRARVGNARRAGITDQRHRLAFRQQAGDPFRGAALIVFMHGHQFAGDAVAIEQADRDPGILGGDDIRSLQHFQRTQGDVAEIPDGRGDYI